MAKIPVGETKGIKFCSLLVLVAPTHFLRLRSNGYTQAKGECPAFYTLQLSTGLDDRIKELLDRHF